MSGITTAQMRKIYALSRERGLDNETLHVHIRMLTKKDSVKELTIREAITVIDSLEAKKQEIAGMMTDKQKQYITGLLVRMGWTKADGSIDESRFMGFVRERFHIEKINWITSKVASQIIEALKNMAKRVS